jgi:hypothetical protein
VFSVGESAGRKDGAPSILSGVSISTVGYVSVRTPGIGANFLRLQNEKCTEYCDNQHREDQYFFSLI